MSPTRCIKKSPFYHWPWKPRSSIRYVVHIDSRGEFRNPTLRPPHCQSMKPSATSRPLPRCNPVCTKPTRTHTTGARGTRAPLFHSCSGREYPKTSSSIFKVDFRVGRNLKAQLKWNYNGIVTNKSVKKINAEISFLGSFSSSFNWIFLDFEFIKWIVKNCIFYIWYISGYDCIQPLIAKYYNQDVACAKA